MNNRYIFRGKRTDNGKWIYGDLIIDQYGKYYIHPNANAFSVNEYNLAKCIQMIEVIPETVGQYTGLTDKNGKCIFEGDVVKFRTDKIAYVEYSHGAFVLKFINDDRSSGVISEVFIVSCEVIGNIHDNPELLKGG